MTNVGELKFGKPAGILAALLIAAVGCGQSGTSGSAPARGDSKPHTARPAAVAGLFYPKDPKALADTIDGYLASAKTQNVQRVRALVCPHAGYEFSGPTAAHAYKLIAGGKYDTVIILAPSHYAWFRGASVPAVRAYETPLGKVPISEKVGQLATNAGFVVEPRCQVQRPPWAGTLSKLDVAPGADTPETWEHSAEVQVPFLQRTLKDFKILPVIFGQTDAEQVARAITPLIDDQTLIIASSDLSHYHPYEEARSLDQRTVQWIKDMDTKALESDRASESACGRVPILTLLYLAKSKGWQPRVLDYRNSGDTAGDKGRVVGYAAVAFGEAKGQASSAEKGTEAANRTNEAQAGEFSQTERKFLLELARQTLGSTTSNGTLPALAYNSVPAACRANRGCFVTLTRNAQLRGCIGNILPAGPLYQAVEDNTRSAALRDYRFQPVTASEAGQLHIEISVLSPVEPLKFKSPEDLLVRLQPHKDGVVLKIGEAGATFLPQVWEQLPDKVDFLNHLAEKAGCRASAWRGKDVSVSIYHVEAFEEEK